MNTLKLIATLSLLLLAGTIAAKNTVKLRPKTLTGKGIDVAYQYDEQNRFTCITVKHGSTIMIDSITYLPRGKGYTLVRSTYDTKENRKKSHPTHRTVVNYLFRVHTSLFVAMDVTSEDTEMTSRVSYSMNRQGKVIQIIWGDELESASTVAFTLDRRGNVQSCDIEKDGTIYSRFYAGLASAQMGYDNKNGIFKYVDTTPLSIIYGEQMPYQFMIENNIVSLKAGSEETIIAYEYNSDGYPIQIENGLLSGFSVVYEAVVEVKK